MQDWTMVDGMAVLPIEVQKVVGGGGQVPDAVGSPALGIDPSMPPPKLVGSAGIGAEWPLPPPKLVGSVAFGVDPGTPPPPKLN
jgi:hypothetical protein